MQLFLLLTLGLNGAIYLVLGQILATEGYSGFFLALGHAAGGALFLTMMCLFSRGRLRIDISSLTYYAGGAIIGILCPAVATFWVIPHIGTGLMSVIIALSPLMTIIIAHAVRTELFDKWRALGASIGIVGVMVIVMNEAVLPTSEDKGFWLIAALLVPFALAAGNVFRSMFWPKGQTPVEAGAGISLVAVILIAPITAGIDTNYFQTVASFDIFLVIFGFVAINGLNAFPYYYLQKIGGPVYLSLLSHAMAFFGVILGILIFGESHRVADYIGMGLILIGVATVNRFRAKKAEIPIESKA